MRRVFAVIIILFSFNHFLFSQVTGKVTDSETGKPLPGVSIIYTDDGRGVITEADGTFSAGPADRLVVSAIGYFTRTVQVRPGKTWYDIQLDPAKYQLQEVVVEAFNRSRRLVDVPGSLSLIPAEQIEREQPVTIVPVINQAPGVFAHSGALNTSRITIRGIGARVPYATGKVRAYLNNIPLTNGSGISIIEDIDPSVMERIEIIKGPATSVYGAGLGGTILITARKPELYPAQVSNNFQAGSWDLFRNIAGLNTGNEKFGLNLGYNHTQSNGYRQNNQYRRDGLTAVITGAPGDNTAITALLVYTSLKAHIPSSIDSITYAYNPRSAAANWLRTRGYEDYDKMLAGVSADHSFSSSLSGNISLFSTIYNEMEMRPFDVLNEDRAGGGTRVKMTWSGNTRQGSYQLLGGTELFTEKYGYSSHENIGGLGEKGSLISDNDERISFYNLFLQGDIDLSRLHVSGGLNLNSSRTVYTSLFRIAGEDPSGRYNYGRIYSPRLSANYRYFQGNSVFFTISHGFSPPSLAETLTPEGSINPDIRPEKSWNIEGGLRGNLFENRLFYDLNIYRMQVQDLLVAERVGEDAWVGRNAGESVHRGVEGEFQVILFRTGSGSGGRWWGMEELRLSPNITINDFRFTDFNDRGTDHSGNRLPGIPDHVLNAGVYGRFGGGLYVFLNTRLVGSMPMNDANSLYYPGYNVTNFTLGYNNRISQNLLADAYIVAGNVFNAQYASMILVNAPTFGNNPPRYYYPGHPLNFSAGIRLSYRFNQL
jgi:iron complex outermembrane recepter protein